MNQTQDSLVFRIDEKLLQRRPPRLTLAATLTALCKQMRTGNLDANFVVDILNENGLSPYMIGHSKSLVDVSLGRYTNASKVGDLIVSEECIRGTYELCISFLEFVLATVCDPNYLDNSRTILASVTYVCNEIYTSHQIWPYKNINDMNRILCLCTEIFHHIIANAQEPTKNSDYKDLEIVCILSLSQNQAHKQMLDVIVGGKNSIKKRMEELDSTNETSLKDDPVIKSVRQSLTIFNKLLLYSKFVETQFNSPNQTQSSSRHGVPSSASPVTSIEKALFDTSIRPGLLQHIFSYIYEKNDSTTACLAVDLIKNIAKKFSMSLMACLGSEADKVCEFFVECLADDKAKTEWKVAILDLLSTFVKHQPGLIELFLNFKRESRDTDGKETSGSLESFEVVMNLLKQFRVQQEDSHKLLHTYVMKLILTFWQKQHSATEQFDKADQFWESVAHPLVKFLDSDKVTPPDTTTTTTTTTSTGNSASKENKDSTQALSDKLDYYTLMILAREIYCLNVGINERKMNPSLRSILDDMSARNFLGKYSMYIRKRYPILLSNLTTKSDDESGRILMAWRDFLISYAKFKPFELDDSIQNQIIEDLLSCMTEEIKLGFELDKERIVAIGDTLLILWTKWVPKTSSDEDVFKSIHELLYLTDSFKEYLPFSFLLTFQSTLSIYLMRHREYLLTSKRLSDLLTPALQLMQFSLRIMEKYLREHFKSTAFDYKPDVESRLCLASIMTLRFIIDVSRNDVSLWFSYLHTNLRTDALVQFLIYLMNKRAGSEVCLSLVELLLCLSSIPETADYLNKAGLINQVNMIAVSAYEKPYAHLSQLASINPINKAKVPDAGKIFLDNANSDHQWLPIWWHIIRLNISMMLTLDKDFMPTAMEFLSIHSLRVCELLEALRTKSRSINMEEASQVSYMINLVLRHGRMWKERNSKSLSAVSEEVSKTANYLTNNVLPFPDSEKFERLVTIFKMSRRYLSLIENKNLIN